ncbi:hypothetical protein HDR58_08655 [bacterium]|nr:hypothetical protein [bacterium]
MSQNKLIEENKHIFNKKKAQELISEASSIIEILLTYCENNIDTVETINIFYMVKYISKLSDKLYCELEGWEVL